MIMMMQFVMLFDIQFTDKDTFAVAKTNTKTAADTETVADTDTNTSICMKIL